MMLLAGCFLRPERPAYVTSEELAPIEVPEGLDRPETRPVFEIPGYSLPELAAQGDESIPPQVLTSVEAEQARSRVKFGPTGLYLEVDDEAASVWRRLGFALNRGEMAIDATLPEQRRYRVEFRHDPILVPKSGFFQRVLMFWSAPDFIDFSGAYQFEIQPESSTTTRIAIFDGDGDVVPMERAEFVLSRLQQRLG
ncbi:hypothetical protein HFP89_09760 [Wenzhouxiangella sp. XN79A]|uniref:hypothetical protein n=1 Tax=Wenzhouxiangella sp. XN79A TaxID=2724193 RepID=UPI00144AD506|nr:hypothetical protein [Wenzhouxiangella sp. XN79A]NKI35453.1 hypothetical protein [Wenzhouxiangella sp. XN79A]